MRARRAVPARFRSPQVRSNPESSDPPRMVARAIKKGHFVRRPSLAAERREAFIPAANDGFGPFATVIAAPTSSIPWGMSAKRNGIIHQRGQA